MKRLDFRSGVMGLLLLGVIAGCTPQRPDRGATTRPYFGETLSLPEMVERINQNNARIPSLWSRVSYEAWIREPETGRETYLVEDDNANLMYRAPAEFRLIARKTGAGTILDIGINKERFWLTAPKPGPDAMWWGEVGKSKRISSRVPIPPQAMLEVLGITTLNTDLLAEPAPVVRFNNDARVYMLVWVTRDEDRYIATREVWYDMKTLLPVKVLMFDRDGRALIRADLKRHEPIDAKVSGSPRVARVYELFFPETRSIMHLELTSVMLERDGAPDDRSFRFVENVPVAREIRVDE